jgi:hypothetical protein
LDRETTYQLIMNHGRMDVMLYYAELNSDHERLVSHHIQRREWTKALDVLAKTSDPELFYRSGREISRLFLLMLSALLIQHAPRNPLGCSIYGCTYLYRL